jgi:hypothetical protein
MDYKALYPRRQTLQLSEILNNLKSHKEGESDKSDDTLWPEFDSA